MPHIHPQQQQQQPAVRKWIPPLDSIRYWPPKKQSPTSSWRRFHWIPRAHEFSWQTESEKPSTDSNNIHLIQDLRVFRVSCRILKQFLIYPSIEERFSYSSWVSRYLSIRHVHNTMLPIYLTQYIVQWRWRRRRSRTWLATMLLIGRTTSAADLSRSGRRIYLCMYIRMN